MSGALRASTDPAELDIAMRHGALSTESSWSRGIPRPRLERALANSLCFDACWAGRQLGFARLATDQATTAYLCDVFLVAGERGRGHAKALLAISVAQPWLQGLRRFSLASSSAHGRYAKFGFSAPYDPSSWMEKFDRDVYRSIHTL